MSEPRTDITEEIRERFARMIAGQLNEAREGKRFDRLVLVAPVKMLGEIKQHVNAKVLKCLQAEMPKDLTHYDRPSLAGHLGGIA